MAIHDKFADLAERLITKHGRTMVLRKISRTPDDGTKPWRGPDTSPADGYEFQQSVTAVMTDYEDDEIDGEQVRRSDKQLLVAAKPNVLIDLLKADSLLDESQVFSVVSGRLLKPGTTAILYTFQVRQ